MLKDRDERKTLSGLVKLSNKLLADISNVASRQPSEPENVIPGTFFSESYQRWYSQSRECIKRMLPARLTEFEFLYYAGPKRKTIIRENYSIRDWLLDVRKSGNRAAMSRVNYFSRVVMLRFYRQCLILYSVESRFKSASFSIDSAIIDFNEGTRDFQYEQDYLDFLTSCANVFIASKDFLFDGPEASRFREVLLESLEKKGIVIDV
jgi:hypothetical protein